MEDMKQVRKRFVVVAAIAAKLANDNRSLYQQLQASLALELARQRRIAGNMKRQTDFAGGNQTRG
jgi:hypothetical protein